MALNAQQLARRRKMKYGLNALLLTLSVIGLMGVAFVAIERTQWRVDLTANQSFTLSKQTRGVLDHLDQKIIIRAFFRPNGDLDEVFIRRKVDDVLRQYAARSSQVDYRLVDPDLDVEEAMHFGIRMNGTIVFQAGAQRKDINQSVLFNYPSLAEASVPLFVGESLFTNALLSVTSDDIKNICLLQGHGERQVDVVEADGLSEVVTLLKQENYQTTPIGAGSMRTQLKGCDVVVVAGPKLGFHRDEEAQLVNAVMSGQKFIFLVDPRSAVSLELLWRQFGIALPESVVFDPQSHFALGSHYPVVQLADHELTAPLKQQELNPVFYLARSIAKAESVVEDFKVSPLLQTSPVAWGETQLKAQQKSEPNKEVDLMGPLHLGVAVTRLTKTEAGEATETPTAIVIGDSNFITNGLIQVPGNRDLFMNSIAWLLELSDQVSIRPVKPDFRPLVLSPQIQTWVQWGTQLVYPALFLTISLWYWRRRRQQRG